MKNKSLALVLVVVLMLTSIIPSFAAGLDDRLAVVKHVGIMNGDENGNLDLERLVTRAEFVKMLVAASVFKEDVGDYSNVSVFSDVAYSHWAASYIKVAIDNGWISGYLDGSFRPNQKVTLEEGVTVLLNALGYTKDVLKGAYPSVQLLKYKEIDLDKNIMAKRGTQLTRRDCVTLFYNFLNAKNSKGKVYASLLDYELNSEDKINLSALLDGEVEGPFVVTQTGQQNLLPFDMKYAEVYKNNEKSSLKSLNLYDVVYFNETSKKVWIYTKKIYGALTEVSPSIVAPKTITVGGKPYSVHSDFKTEKLRSGYSIGDEVTLLIGDDGTAVDIVPIDGVNRVRYGMVLKAEASTYIDEDGRSKIADFATVATTDGVVSDYIYSGKLEEGDIVTVTILNGSIVLKKAKKHQQSGLFNADDSTLGGRKIADDIEIMDLGKNGTYKILKPEDLDGEYLAMGDVVTVSYDATGRIDGIILNNTSGDLMTYGLFTKSTDNYQDILQKDGTIKSVVVSKTYTFIKAGKTFDVMVEPDRYDLTAGGVGFVYDVNGRLNDVEDLMQTHVDNLTQTRIISGTKSYDIADNVQVYYVDKDDNYTLVDKATISDEYLISAYYDVNNRTQSKIRVIKLQDK